MKINNFIRVDIVLRKQTLVYFYLQIIQQLLKMAKRNVMFHPIISSIQRIALYETKAVRNTVIL